MRIGEALFAGSLAVLAGPVAPPLPPDTDPVFAEAYTSCLAAIEGGGSLDENVGWTGHDSGDPDAVAWKHWSRGYATKEVAGVGILNLSATVQNYAGHKLGLCSVTVTAPEREIAAPALTTAGFKGTLEGDAADWSGLWRNANGNLFVEGLMSTNARQFRLSLTSVDTRS
jgi:hypothetical protein